jgi:hypothetical protein
MSDSPTAQTLNTILRLGLDPALRQAGYKRRAHTFRQPLPTGVWRVINVQGSQGNAGSRGRFTLNLGIHFPQVRAVMGHPPLPNPPKEWDCELRARIGTLLPGGQDHWWQFDEHTDVQAIADNVVQAWREYGQPWLTRYSDLRTARDEIGQGQYPFRIAASLALGEPDAARHWVRACRTDPIFAHRANQGLPAWVTALGLNEETTS